MILSIDNLSFQYSSRTILSDIRFSLGAHEILAIMGPNGVGKTTLLKCINRLITPRAGTILIEGDDTSGLENQDLARLIGYVPQRTETGRITAFDAILLGRRPHIRWRISDHDLKVVHAAITRLGIESLSLRYIDEMSGGELQKVAIARAVVQEPRLLLLDEPTSSLDLKNQVDILSGIRDITKNHSVSVVMTMHDLTLAFRFADRFIFLKDGLIYAAGLKNEITEDIISEVYGVRVTIGDVAGFPVVVPAV
ncbi:MAG TPA: ABC transporter ATP-binding protein [Methanospirillum sp.]|nr:ABC transporter ATP-binding protein [Methanospirillum sp.]